MGPFLAIYTGSQFTTAVIWGPRPIWNWAGTHRSLNRLSGISHIAWQSQTASPMVRGSGVSPHRWSIEVPDETRVSMTGASIEVIY